MKILFSDNAIWGLLNFRLGIINHFLSCGYDVVLVAPCDELSRVEQIPRGAKYIPITMDRTSTNPYKDMGYLYRLFKIYSAERPDYIFHYTIKPNIYGSFIANILHIRSCAVITGLGYVFSKNSIANKIAREMYRLALKYPEKIIVLNRENAEILTGRGFISHDRMILLPGGEGVNLSKYNALPYPHNNRIQFLMIGRLLYEKGYSEYVAVAQQLCDRADFYIMGALDTNPTGVPEQVVRRDVEKGYIRYIPFSPDVISYINKADCIVLPSYHEGLSRVLMEALAIGRPIICSDIPGCRETVKNNINGLLCKPHSVNSLKEACEKFLLLSYEERSLMGMEGRKLAESVFDEKQVINQFVHLL